MLYTTRSTYSDGLLIRTQHLKFEYVSNDSRNVSTASNTNWYCSCGNKEKHGARMVWMTVKYIVVAQSVIVRIMVENVIVRIMVESLKIVRIMV